MKRTRIVLALLLALTMSLALIACGGTKEYTVSFSGADVAAQTVKKGETAERPAVDPNLVGYDFVGWFADEALTEEYDFSAPIQKDTTIYAKFQIKTFTVTFKEVDLPAEKVEYNKTIETSDPTPPDGQIFVGWYTNAGKTQAFLKDTKITKNIELWPKFKDSELPADQAVTVTFVNPSRNESETIQVKKGEGVPEGRDPVFYHKYENFYIWDGWDGDLEEPLYEDTTFTAQYVFDESTIIPSHYFTYTLLEDGTYGLSSNYTVSGSVESLSQPCLTGSKMLPTEYNGKPITKIMSYAFSNHYIKYDLEELLVPECYKVLGYWGLSGGYTDKAIFLGLETIEQEGFIYCGNENYYATIELPATLKNIVGDFLCTFAPGRANIIIDENNPYFHFEADEFGNEVLYNTARDTIHFVKLNSNKFTFPENVTNIVPGLFRNQILETLTFEGDKDSIPGQLMQASYTDVLKYVVFEGKVRRLEKNAFHAERGIVAFVLPEGLEYIGEGALYDVNLAKVYIDDSVWRLMSTCGLGGGRMTAGYELMWDELTLIEKRGNAIIELGGGPDGGDAFILYDSTSGESVYTVPNGVTCFKPVLGTCFTGNDLRKIVVPEGVKELPSGFCNLGELTFVEVGEAGDLNVEYKYELISQGLDYLSLPSTLEKICTGAIRSVTFKGFEWPNGSNLKYLSTSCIVSFMNYEEILLPDTIETIEKRPFSEVYNPKIVGTTGKYITFGGFIYEKLNDRELKLINLPFDMGNEELIFPDTGDYVLTQIGRKVMTENSNSADLTAYWSSLKRLEIPEGVEYIGDEAFAFQRDLEELVLPSTLKEIANGAFYYSLYLQTVTFNSVEPPKMQYVNYYLNELYENDYSKYEVFMTGYKVAVLGSPVPITYFGPGLECKFIVPEGSYEAYFRVFHDYCGDTYAGRISTANQEKYTYRFHTNGGNNIFDIEQTPVLWEMPLTVWKGEGTKHLQGYYTKDGTVDGDWGERVESYPYFGTPDRSGVIELFARWGDEVYEDGRGWNNAYVISTEERTIAARTYEYLYFQFTPEVDGMYDLFISYYGYFNSLELELNSGYINCPIFTVNQNKELLNGLDYFYILGNDRPYWPNSFGPFFNPYTTSYIQGINPLTNISYKNMRAGTTYYFVFNIGDEMYEYRNNRRETIDLTIYMDKVGEYGAVIGGLG